VQPHRRRTFSGRGELASRAASLSSEARLSTNDSTTDHRLRTNDSRLTTRSRTALASSRWQPFLTGGVLIVASGDAAGVGFTIGGGVDRWFTRHAGIRIDVRDQFLPGLFSLVGCVPASYSAETAVVE
jgi:hypothetical protein